jgi:hypothetical protein
MFILLSSTDHIKSLHSPILYTFGLTFSYLIACGITISRHYRNVHSYDQLICGFLQGLALLLLTISLREDLIYFREDYLATCSLTGLLINPVFIAYNCLLCFGYFQYVNDKANKPGWYREMEKLCGDGKVVDSCQTFSYWRLTIPAFYGAYLGAVVQARFIGPKHQVLVVDENGDMVLL